MLKTNYRLLLSVIIAAFLLNSCHLKKAFDALEIYNYFEAKKQFEKSLERNLSPASYGLSVIYFRQDNPFSDLDSAYFYSLLSVESYENSLLKKQIKWSEKYSFSNDIALAHREEISDFAYETALQENTVNGFVYFMEKNPWSKHFDAAKSAYDSLAFLDAKKIGTSQAITEFIDQFSNSKWVDEAQELLYLAQYSETVKEKETHYYMEFIRKFPENPYVQDAQLQVYELETKDNTIAEYASFVKRFSNSPYINEVWKKLYRLSIADYEKESIRNFAIAYPYFPFPEMIKRDLQLAEQTLYQIIKNGKYGFMNNEGEIVITPKFEYAGTFKNGMAVVIKDNKYGYINKYGEVKIDYIFDEAFDFQLGRAVVVIDDYFGLIDVAGNYILKDSFLDIGSLSDSIFYVQSEDGYKFYNLQGELEFHDIFDEAFSFKNGLALVKKDGKSGFIDKTGNFYISIDKGSLSVFTDTLFIHKFLDSANLVTANGKRIFKESFNRIGVLSNNRAIVEKSGNYGYIDGSGKIVIPLRYKPFSNYLEFAQFNNGFAVYKQGDKFAMIDSSGNRILPSLFTGIGIYGELIPVTAGNKWGYVNRNAQLKIRYQYDYAYEFVERRAIVEKAGNFGLIDLSGGEILPIDFEFIKRIENNLLLVKKDNLYGIYTNQGEELVSVEFERINEISDGLFQLIRKDEVVYFDVLKNKLIKLNE